MTDHRVGKYNDYAFQIQHAGFANLTNLSVGITLHNVESMLNGELLDEFHSALSAQDESESLRFFLENEVEKEKK